MTSRFFKLYSSRDVSFPMKVHVCDLIPLRGRIKMKKFSFVRFMYRSEVISSVYLLKCLDPYKIKQRSFSLFGSPMNVNFAAVAVVDERK